jgi:SAM-dependent methyltransferase
VLDCYVPGASILDLGCGTGMTAVEVAPLFSEYVGVDISHVAISKATAMVQSDNARTAKVHYVAADIATYVPDRAFSVILFRESIYYFSTSEVLNLLNRYASFLSSSGVFIVRIHDREKHKRIVKLVQSHFEIIIGPDAMPGQKIAVLAFSPRRTASSAPRVN